MYTHCRKPQQYRNATVWHHCPVDQNVASAVHSNVKQEAQLSLGLPTILVVSDLQDHPRSMIFISSETAYALPIGD